MCGSSNWTVAVQTDLWQFKLICGSSNWSVAVQTDLWQFKLILNNNNKTRFTFLWLWVIHGKLTITSSSTLKSQFLEDRVFNVCRKNNGSVLSYEIFCWILIMMMLSRRKIAIQAELERSPSWTENLPSTLQPRLMISRIAWHAQVQGKYLKSK